MATFDISSPATPLATSIRVIQSFDVVWPLFSMCAQDGALPSAVFCPRFLYVDGHRDAQRAALTNIFHST